MTETALDQQNATQKSRSYQSKKYTSLKSTELSLTNSDSGDNLYRTHSENRRWHTSNAIDFKHL